MASLSEIRKSGVSPRVARKQRDDRIFAGAAGASAGGYLGAAGASAVNRPRMRRNSNKAWEEADSRLRRDQKSWDTKYQKWKEPETDRVSRLRNMANQTKSPHEATTAKEKLKRMGASDKKTAHPGPKPSSMDYAAPAAEKAAKLLRNHHRVVAGGGLVGGLAGAAGLYAATKNGQKASNEAAARRKAKKREAALSESAKFEKSEMSASFKSAHDRYKTARKKQKQGAYATATGVVAGTAGLAGGGVGTLEDISTAASRERRAARNWNNSSEPLNPKYKDPSTEARRAGGKAFKGLPTKRKAALAALAAGGALTVGGTAVAADQQKKSRKAAFDTLNAARSQWAARRQLAARKRDDINKGLPSVIRGKKGPWNESFKRSPYLDKKLGTYAYGRDAARIKNRGKTWKGESPQWRARQEENAEHFINLGRARKAQS